MLDVNRLIALREVKLRGSITAAALRLGYSHAAISQQLSSLERHIGIALLEKVGRTVKLTPAGEELVRNTEPILAALERAESALSSSQSEVQGVLVVAAFATISRTVLPGVLGALHEKYSGLDVRVQLHVPEEAIIRLVSRQVDVVVADGYSGTAGVPAGDVHATLLGRDPVRAYLPQGMTDDLESLRRVRWTLEPRSTASAEWAMRICRERGIEPIVAHESADLLFHLRMVEAGQAAAFLPDMVVREAGSSLQPSTVLPAAARDILLLARAGSEYRPAIVALRDELREALGG